MNIITEPGVHLLAEPIFHPHPKYKVPKWTVPAEAIVAHAGKGCYDSYGEDGRNIREHIDALIKSKHGSVLEHVYFTLFLEGISRGLSHELVRHRAGFAFSQRSTRYTAEEDASIVLDPYYAALYEDAQGPALDIAIRDDRIALENNKQFNLVVDFIRSCQRSFAAYREQVTMLMELNPENMSGHNLRKWARGKARQLLPHALETRMTITANLRSWRHFFEQRTSRWAEEEIRRLAYGVYTLLAPRAGCILEDYAGTPIRGIPELTTENTKV